MMCDIFNNFRPHINGPHSRSITVGPFAAHPTPRHYSGAPAAESRTLWGLSSSLPPPPRTINIYWVAGRRPSVRRSLPTNPPLHSTHRDHARLLAAAFCSRSYTANPLFLQPCQAAASTSAQGSSDSRPGKKKGRRDSSPTGRSNPARGEPTGPSDLHPTPPDTRRSFCRLG